MVQASQIQKMAEYQLPSASANSSEMATKRPLVKINTNIDPQSAEHIAKMQQFIQQYRQKRSN